MSTNKLPLLSNFETPIIFGFRQKRVPVLLNPVLLNQIHGLALRGPIHAERCRQKRLKEQGPEVTLDFSHFYPDIDGIKWKAGLYKIDVSNWAPDDFKEPPPSWRGPEPMTTAEAEPQDPLSDVDVSNWMDIDFDDQNN